MSYTVRLACKTYIRNFLAQRFGSPANFPRHSDERALLQLALVKDFPASRNEAVQGSSYNTHIELSIGMHAASECGVWLSAKSQRLLHQNFEADFDRTLYDFVVLRMQLQNKTLTEALLLFQAAYSISETDLSLSGLQTRFYRYRGKVRTKIFAQGENQKQRA